MIARPSLGKAGHSSLYFYDLGTGVGRGGLLGRVLGVGANLGVLVAVEVGVGVGVEDGVTVAVAVGLGVGVGVDAAAQYLPPVLK